MVFRAIRLILGLVLVIVAAILIVKAVPMFSAGGGDLRELVLPLGMIIGSLVVLAAFYSAFFRQKSAFDGFRIILGAVVVMLVYYFLAPACADICESLKAKTFKAAVLGGPIINLILAVAVVAVFVFLVAARTGIRRVLENIFSVPDLLKKVAFTLALLCIYRVGFHIPLPGLNQEALSGFMERQSGGPLGQAMEYFAMFTGGNLQKCTLFGLGIMPYISASIIFQLLVTVVPALEKLQKEGQAGYKKIQEYTRYATVLLCVVQAIAIYKFVMNPGKNSNLYPEYADSVGIFLMAIFGLTAGTMFLMWLGEQIDEYGVGNGISLIIMAGIVARLPWAIRELISRASLKVTGGGGGEIGLIKIVFLIGAFIFVVAGSILITQAQRRIPVQQAKHTRGRRVYGGQRQYLPLRVNHGGVMPIIFASSLMMFFNAPANWIAGAWPTNWFAAFLGKAFSMNHLVYQLVYVGMIFFFAYFWTTVQFRPKDMSDQLRDTGAFIPGLRPGKRTADYLERVMERITYCGAAFLALIAVIPQVVAASMGIPFNIAAYLGGTGLLIMVSVALDVIQRIEAELIMRNYGGFLSGGGRIKGARG